MKAFMDKDFMLDNETAQQLYHEHAAKMPIIDYHCHLNPEFIAKDRQFDNLGQIWLEGDHYKWRAMRTNGIEERFCTGKETTDWEKFEKWAATVPYTMRNPLYHWTHLELRSVFGVNTLLKPETAKEIFDACTAKLRTPEFSARGLMKRCNVKVVCTTDDPVDSLEYHIALKNEGFEVKVLPTWRPDKAMTVENAANFRAYIEKLADVSGVSISKFADVIEALRVRHKFFESVGCKLSDHGIEEFYAEDYTQAEIDAIFNKVYGGTGLTKEEIVKFKSAMLVEFAVMDWETGWTQQFHFGTIRDNNSRLFKTLGPDTGFDSIGDFTLAKAMSKFLNRLDTDNKLTKTILYNLNPRDNDLITTMIGNFQDGSVAGKIQFGSGWWFLDQEIGMTAQMNSLSVLGSVEPLCGHVDRLAQLPLLSSSRVLPPYPV
jgi:Glucuronate isomerase